MKIRNKNKWIGSCLLLLVLVLMNGCQNNKDRKEEASSIKEQTASSVKEETSVTQPEVSTDSEENETADAEDKADVDLTTMNSNMVYAEVFQMMVNPDEYTGKTVRMRGQYYSAYYEDTDKRYFYVIISDATQCCSQGMEFVWEDDSHTYPEEYPPEETEVEITGVFETYKESGDDTLYCHLLTDDIVVVE